jgi:hypothetical protein
MQIEIANEAAAAAAAQAAGYENVQEYVNVLIKREADLLALREGIADAEVGNVTPFDEFDAEFRRENGFSPKANG